MQEQTDDVKKEVMISKVLTEEKGINIDPVMGVSLERPWKVWLELCGSHRLRVGVDTEDLLERPYLGERHR